MIRALVPALLLAGCATAPASVVQNALPLATPGVPAGMQYLYGSGEAAAASAQTWRAIVHHVGGLMTARPLNSVVLAAGATLAAPAFVPCGQKPFAVVFDVDETVLLNLGFEYNDALDPQPYDEARWQDWERTGADKVAASPGAVDALRKLRTMGTTVIFNSNRSVGNVDATAAAIKGAGLGTAKHGDTLFVAGDDATGTKKDGRRAAIAARYCVLAMGGDQLGDFSDLFNAGLAPAPRRSVTLGYEISKLWGAGWFLFPNPVYGSALKGGADDVFPADKRWAPQGKK